MARINGTPFSDYLVGDIHEVSENDEIYGYEDNDTLDGLGGNDKLYGGDGLDTLWGFTGNDTLYGQAGNDTLDGGSGNDWLDGGDGNDTASYSTATAGVRIELTPETHGIGQNTVGAGFDTLLNIENLTGSKYNDTLSSEGIDNITLNGRGGIDSLYANYSFNFRLNGEAGDDHLVSGHGIGTLNGGAGNDHLESYEGGVLNGGDGNDVLEAGYIFSIDTILNGDAGDDVLTILQDGGTLNGGSGKDTLTGGLGKDIFDYNAASESLPNASKDVITNFKWSEGDTIDLSTIDANTLLAGNQAFGLEQVSYSTTTGTLSANIIGTSAVPDLQIQVLNDGAPVGDFVVSLDVIL